MKDLIKISCCVCGASLGSAAKGTNSAVCCYACKRKRDIKARKVKPNPKSNKKTTRKRKTR